MSRYMYAISLSAMAISSCKKPYTPSVVVANNNYLVVEGVINGGQDSTVIQLSRMVNLTSKTTVNPEGGAKVSVQGDQNISYALKETKPGRYVSAPLNLDKSHKYLLKIVSADGRVYQSDMVEVKTTPPIDTLYYTTDNADVNIFTATHDPANNTHYYRWDFTETYIYETPRTTNFIYNGSIKYISQRVVSRTPDQYINLCYDTDTATSIILNSSAKLAQDVINNNPITQIPAVSEKILHRYSILVKQYALTSDAYNFWQNLKKNTEQLGSIFDALPSEVNGNIHCVSNPSEPVIGYMSVCSVSQKRIFIDRTELPVWPYILPTCNVPGATIIWFRQQGIPVELTNGVDIPVAPIGSGFDKVHQDSVYSVSVREYSCVDCRYHNFGTTLKPAFWK